MTLSYNFRFILFFFIFISSFGFAQQSFQGKAHYISKTQMDLNSFGRKDMSEEQKKRMSQRLKNMSEKTYTLSFNKAESIFKLQEKLQTPSQSKSRNRFGSMISGAVDGDIYKNIQNNQLLITNELLGKQFLIKDELPILEWKMTGESKKIGQYMCFKATAIKNWQDLNIATFRRPRNDNKSTQENIEAPKVETTVTAWYTMQIPVNHGPGNYWGLPGLILELSTDKTTILCSKIVLNPNDKLSIKQPTKGKEITKEDYTKIATKKFSEMRENFRKRRGNNSGRRN